MKERPILMSAPMVRALLEGRKTQTRRIVKPPMLSVVEERMAGVPFERVVSPYGMPGDRLWVRETWAIPPGCSGEYSEVVYRADIPDEREERSVMRAVRGDAPWKPSIHMPRLASRLTLEIQDVRVERVQGISEGDAVAEGARHFPDLPGPDPYGCAPRWSMDSPPSTDHCLGSPQTAFANLWIKLNGQESWHANPYVWAISFRRLDKA